MGEEQGIIAFTWGLHQWRRKGVLTCLCWNEESSCVCFSIRLLVEQRISSIRDIFILQNLMKCLGKDAPVFLKKKLEVKLVGGSFLLPQSLCSCIVYKLCMVLCRRWKRKCNGKVTICYMHQIPAISVGGTFIWRLIIKQIEGVKQECPHLFGLATWCFIEALTGSFLVPWPSLWLKMRWQKTGLWWGCVQYLYRAGGLVAGRCQNSPISWTCFPVYVVGPLGSTMAGSRL